MNNKKGFTLAEILVAIGIIAVMAALMASAFNQAKPNKTKMLYLKGYDSLVEAVNLMTNDSTIYNSIYVTGTGSSQRTYNVENNPLLDLSIPLRTSLTTAHYADGDTLKFGKVLEELLNGSGGTANGTVSYSFTTSPGNFSWTVRPLGRPLSTTTGASVNFNNQVSLSIDGGDAFNFCVYSDGKIRTMDSAGQTFINSRKNIKSNGNTVSAATTSCSDPYDVEHISGNDYRVLEGIIYSQYHPEEATNTGGNSNDE